MFNKKQIAVAILMATIPFVGYAQDNTQTIPAQTAKDKFVNNINKFGQSIKVDTELEIGLTATDLGELGSASNYRPEISGRVTAHVANMVKFSISAIEEQNLEDLGDTTFDEDYLERTIKEASAQFELGCLVTKIGDQEATSALGVSSRDVRRRDAQSDKTRQEFESITGVSIAMTDKCWALPAADHAQLDMFVGKVNQVLANLKVTIFDGSSKEKFLSVNSLDSYAIESAFSVGSVTFGIGTIQAENEAGDDKRYMTGVSTVAMGADLYAKGELHDNDASSIENTLLVGIGKSITAPVIDKDIYLSAEYDRIDLGSMNAESIAANAETMVGQWRLGAQVSHGDYVIEDLLAGTLLNQNETRAKVNFSREF